MALNVLLAKTPITIPAIPERICNVVVIPTLNLQHEIVDGSMQLRLTIEVYQAAFDQHGVALSPTPVHRITEPDMFSLSVTDPLAENIMNAATAFVEDRLTKAGFFDEQQSSEDPPSGEP